MGGPLPRAAGPPRPRGDGPFCAWWPCSPSCALLNGLTAGDAAWPSPCVPPWCGPRPRGGPPRPRGAPRAGPPLPRLAGDGPPLAWPSGALGALRCEPGRSVRLERSVVSYSGEAAAATGRGAVFGERGCCWCICAGGSWRTVPLATGPAAVTALPAPAAPPGGALPLRGARGDLPASYAPVVGVSPVAYSYRMPVERATGPAAGTSSSGSGKIGPDDDLMLRGVSHDQAWARCKRDRYSNLRHFSWRCSEQHI
jgi:hypothetical protein